MILFPQITKTPTKEEREVCLINPLSLNTLWTLFRNPQWTHHKTMISVLGNDDRNGMLSW